jgi:hypothetical protein
VKKIFMKKQAKPGAKYPSYPFIVFGPYRELYICDAETPLEHASLYGLVRGFYTSLRVYDSNGDCWHINKVTAPYRVNLWTRFLACTIYNPKFLVTLDWQCDGHYDFKALHDVISNAIEQDGGMPPPVIEQLRDLLGICKSHAEFFSKLRKRV